MEELEDDSDLIILVSEEIDTSINTKSRVAGTITHLDRVVFGKSLAPSKIIRYLDLNGDYCIGEWSHFRVATKIECLWYHLGIRNINQIKEELNV